MMPASAAIFSFSQVETRPFEMDFARNNWIDIKCNGITPKDYESLKNKGQNVPWLCLTCTVLQMAESCPFGLIGNDILLTMNNLDNLCCVNNISNFDIQSKLTDIPNL